MPICYRLPTRSVPVLLGLVLVCSIGWRSPNYYSDETPYWDSSGFLTVAYNMHHGRILYRDIFDHKPPLFFALMYALSDGDADLGVNAVRTFEKVNAAAMCGLVFLISYLFLGNIAASLVAGCFFAFVHYAPLILRGGNLSEEYGNCLYLIVILLCCPPIQKGRSRALLLAVGIVSCLAALIKEPYSLMCLPWMGYAAYLAWKNGTRMVVCAGLLALGVALPLVPFILYFASVGALWDWINVYIVQFTYVGMEGTPDRWTFMKRLLFSSHTAAFLLLVAVVALLQVRRSKGRHYFPHLVLLAYLVSLYASMGLGNRVLNNYLLMQIPPWSLLLAVGADRLFSREGFVPPRVKGWLTGLWQRRAVRGSVLTAAVVAGFGLVATYASWSREVAYYATLGLIRMESDASQFTQALSRLAQPRRKWTRPDQTTLDALLPAATVRREGIMMMHQRTAFYGPMHGVLTPEGTKPYFGISQGLDAMKPDYLDLCARTLRTDPPGVFIGSDQYYFVVRYLTPELTERYEYLGKFPLFLNGDTARDPEYTADPLHWYVRKDLLWETDQELAAQLAH